MEGLDFIKRFIANFDDFNGYDTNKYKAIYNPQYHPNGVCFWFNPPFDENGDSFACVSGALLIGIDDNVYIEDFNSGIIYNISQCINNTINKAVLTIQKRSKF